MRGMHLDGELSFFAVLGGEHGRAVPHRGWKTDPSGWKADRSQLFVGIPGNFRRFQEKIRERRGAKKNILVY